MSNKIKLDKNNISQEEMGTPVMLTEDWGGGGGVSVAVEGGGARGGVAAGGSMLKTEGWDASLTKEIDHLRYEIKQIQYIMKAIFILVMTIFIENHIDLLIRPFS